MRKFKAKGAFDGLSPKQIKKAIKYGNHHFKYSSYSDMYKEFSNDLEPNSLYKMFLFSSDFVKEPSSYWRILALRQSNKELNIKKKHLVGALYGLTVKQAKKVVKYVQKRTDIAGIRFSHKEAYYFCAINNKHNDIMFLFNFDRTKEGADYWLNIHKKQKIAIRKKGWTK